MNKMQARIELTKAMRSSAYRLAVKASGFDREYPISDEWDLQVGWKIFFGIPVGERAAIVKNLNDNGYYDIELEEMLVQFVRMNVLRISCECEPERIAAVAREVC